MGQQIIHVRGQLGSESPGLLGGLFGSKQSGQPGAPPPTGGGSAGAPMPPPPPKPLAGAWERALAFLIDGILLYFLAQLWVPALAPAMQDHSLIMTWLGTAIFIAYFAILNGPIGKGQTLGKKLLQITTRRLDGAPVGWEGALARATVQCLPILLSPLIMVLINAGGTESKKDSIAFWRGCLLDAPLFPFILWNFLMAALRRDKRALHDLAAGAFVCKTSQAPAACEYVRDVSAHANRMGTLMALTIALAALIPLEYVSIQHGRSDPDKIALLTELETRYPLPGYQVSINWRIIQKADAAQSPSAESGKSPAAGESAEARANAPRNERASAEGRAPAPETTSGTALVTAPTTEPWRLMFIYRYEGKTDDQALERTLQDANLTTQAAQWIIQQYRNPQMGYFKKLCEELNKQSRFPLIGVGVEYWETFSLPFFMGGSRDRLVYQAQFPLDNKP
ncbi:MAG: RDD family protein [Candidatus Sumerlaeota bacterium]|nr:RDD family protein [Candidatus Sumerlaeota bacterium]